MGTNVERKERELEIEKRERGWRERGGESEREGL